MDQVFERLNRIYPNGRYVKIPAYNPEQWVDKKYDSHLDNKAALNRWKTNPLTYEEACQAAEEGFRIGWVVPKGYCIIDIDNTDDVRAQSYLEKLLFKFEVKYSYNYTHRGIHMLFQDPDQKIKSNAKMKCGLNIVVDARANETGYIILPVNDPHRRWGEWNDFVEDLPYFLKPLLNDQTPSFIGLEDGDGRNDALFKWRSRLECCHKLNDEEVEKCIRIINENLFTTPIPSKELYKTVLRQKEKSQKISPADKENYYNSLAEDLCSKLNLISFWGVIYKFNGIYYKRLEDIEAEQLIYFELSKNISAAGRKEILSFVKLKTNVTKEELDADWYRIAAKNGIINLITGELQQPSVTDYNTIFVPYEYNTNPSYSPRIDEFMKQIAGGDVVKMQFLYQVAGYTLLKKNMFGKFFIFRGEGGTGKSTFTNLIQKMLGEENVSHIALTDFDKDYHLAALSGKLANIDDDVVDGKTLEYTGKFKSIITGEKISVRKIYEDIKEFIPFVTCMFSCNRLPKIMDKTSGLYRRLILVELNNKVEKPDLLFMDKVTDSDMEYFLFKAVEALGVALQEGKFRISISEEKLLNMFRRRQSPFHEWLYENDLRVKNLENQPCMVLYRQYRDWCENAGYTKSMNLLGFKEDLCMLYDLEVDLARTAEGAPARQVFINRGKKPADFKPF